MGPCGQVLFVQGGGAGVHDDWDAALVADLRRRLGNGYAVRYPRMPAEDDPDAATWAAAVRHEVTTLDPGAVLVGHSVGGTVLLHTVADSPPPRRIAAVVLIAAPFVGAGGWPADGFGPPETLGARLPDGVPVHVVHGSDDDTVPPSHADLWAAAVPTATVHRLPGRDHQLDGDLTEVADIVRSVTTGKE